MTRLLNRVGSPYPTRRNLSSSLKELMSMPSFIGGWTKRDFELFSSTYNIAIREVATTESSMDLAYCRYTVTFDSMAVAEGAPEWEVMLVGSSVPSCSG